MNEQNIKTTKGQRNKWTNGIWIPVVTLVCVSLLGILCYNSYKHWIYEHQVEGSVSLVNEDFKISDSMTCERSFVYGSDDDYVEMECIYNENYVHLTHPAPHATGYTYFFTILGEGKTIKARLDFYKEAEDLHEEWNIIINIYQLDGKLAATITSTEGKGASVECLNIEEDGILLEYWSVGDGIQENYNYRRDVEYN